MRIDESRHPATSGGDNFGAHTHKHFNCPTLQYSGTGRSISSSSASASMDEEDVGQGKLYSPGIQLPVKKKKKKSSSSSREEDDEEMISSRAAGIRWRNVGAIKDTLLEKLTAAAVDVPADSLDNARHFLETVVRDVRLAAHGLTMDAFNRIKSHLSDFLPSLSPSLANKMVEDANQEAAKEEEGDDDEDQLQNKNIGQQEEEERVTNSGSGNNNKPISSFMFPTSSSSSSSFVSLVKPRSRL